MRLCSPSLLLLAGLLAMGTALPAHAAKKAEKHEDKIPRTSTFSGRVERILDGDTIILEGDRRVRLLDIDTPEIGHNGQPSEPYAQQATDALRNMVFGQYVTVQQGPQKKDKFDRLLGHVFLSNGGWVNGSLVRDGYAHVYTFAENALYAPELQAYENTARAAHLGIWSLPRWQVRSAATCCAKTDIGTYQVVEGNVLAAAHVQRPSGGRTYLNFGKDWKTDFSLFIADKDTRFFRKAGIKNVAEEYRGKKLRIHGHLQPVNGVLVRVTHPAQIEILE